MPHHETEAHIAELVRGGAAVGFAAVLSIEEMAKPNAANRYRLQVWDYLPAEGLIVELALRNNATEPLKPRRVGEARGAIFVIPAQQNLARLIARNALQRFAELQKRSVAGLNVGLNVLRVQFCFPLAVTGQAREVPMIPEMDYYIGALFYRVIASPFQVFVWDAGAALRVRNYENFRGNLLDKTGVAEAQHLANSLSQSHEIAVVLAALVAGAGEFLPQVQHFVGNRYG